MAQHFEETPPPYQSSHDPKALFCTSIDNLSEAEYHNLEDVFTTAINQLAQRDLKRSWHDLYRNIPQYSLRLISARLAGVFCILARRWLLGVLVVTFCLYNVLLTLMTPCQYQLVRDSSYNWDYFTGRGDYCEAFTLRRIRDEATLEYEQDPGVIVLGTMHCDKDRIRELVSNSADATYAASSRLMALHGNDTMFNYHAISTGFRSLNHKVAGLRNDFDVFLPHLASYITEGKHSIATLHNRAIDLKRSSFSSFESWYDIIIRMLPDSIYDHTDQARYARQLTVCLAKLNNSTVSNLEWANNILSKLYHIENDLDDQLASVHKGKNDFVAACKPLAPRRNPPQPPGQRPFSSASSSSHQSPRLLHNPSTPTLAATKTLPPTSPTLLPSVTACRPSNPSRTKSGICIKMSSSIDWSR